MLESLWGEDFNIPEESEKVKTKKILNKIAKPKEVKMTIEKQINSKTISLEDKLKLINEEVIRVLGKQKDNILCIKDRETLHNYIDKAIQNKIIAIDTETNNSLDPITCKLMGPCIYTPGEKQAYIPLNHRDPNTKERYEWQLTEVDIEEEFKRLICTKTFTLFHNGKFDYEVIKCTCNNLELPINWDTMIAAKLLDENEFSAGLKQQYITKIDPDQEKYSIDHLFEGVEYADVDPEIFSYYSATDALMTYKLYEYQKGIITTPEYAKIYKLFKEVEMPLVQVLAEMELNGMQIDQDYAQRLSSKYHKKLNLVDQKLNDLLTELQPKINAWKLTDDAAKGQNKKLSEKQYANALKSPKYDASLYSNIKGDWYKISKSKLEQFGESDITAEDLSSPVKLGILLYDILKCPIVNKEKPYATGEEEIELIKQKTKLPICDLILERRELVKLITTYIDSIPELAKRWSDGRVRTHFNQYGAQTGRLSSSDPVNFQNIPSHEKAIRLLFKAKNNYRIIGADYSAQEPRLVAHYSQDKNMLDAYLNKRDLYSVIASMSFGYPYEECLEFYPEGTKIQIDGKEVICGYKTHQNKDGKTRRTMAKSILLGILYGRGAASVGEQIGKTKEEAQEILDKFFKAFPTVKEWIDQSKENCRELGYVEDIAGRRRRLPDIQLPKYTIRYKDANKQALSDFNPFLNCSNRITSDRLIDTYKEQLDKARSRQQVDNIKNKALENGIEIINNGGFISQAERQCVNARVQGGAATLTKCALIRIFNDNRLKELGAKIVNCVHDEILLEGPERNSEKIAELLSEDMIQAAKAWVPIVPMASDTYNVAMWYQDEYEVLIQNEYKHLIEGDDKKGIKPLSNLDAQNKLIQNHEELLPEDVIKAIKGIWTEIID